ncbi:MAG: hypothetical protein Q8P95_00330 [bacterium]|nr:hypothetical protein [bacterium]
MRLGLDVKDNHSCPPLNISKEEYECLLALVCEHFPDCAADPRGRLARIIDEFVASRELLTVVSFSLARIAILTAAGVPKGPLRPLHEDEGVQLPQFSDSEPAERGSCLSMAEVLSEIVRRAFHLQDSEMVQVLAEEILQLSRASVPDSESDVQSVLKFCSHVSEHWHEIVDYWKLLLFRTLIQRILRVRIDDEVLEVLRMETNFRIILASLDEDRRDVEICFQVLLDYLSELDNELPKGKREDGQASDLRSSFDGHKQLSEQDLLAEYSRAVGKCGGDTRAHIEAAIAFKRHAITDERARFLLGGDTSGRVPDKVFKLRRKHPDAGIPVDKVYENATATLSEFEAVRAYERDPDKNVVRQWLGLDPREYNGSIRDPELARTVRIIVERKHFPRYHFSGKRPHWRRLAVKEDHLLAVEAHSRNEVTDEEFLERVRDLKYKSVQQAKSALRGMFPKRFEGLEVRARLGVTDEQRIAVAHRWLLGDPVDKLLKSIPGVNSLDSLRCMVRDMKKAYRKLFVGYPKRRGARVLQTH